LDPASDPAEITNKLAIDATTPMAPETHGHYAQELKDPVTTDAWLGFRKGNQVALPA
jgi:4-hydroxybenzoate decarboxylase